MAPKGVIKQIAASFRLSKKYCIRSCHRHGASDCLVCATANLDVVLSGNDVSKIKFNQKLLRSFFVESFIAGRLYFPFSRCERRGEGNVYPMQCVS